MKIKRFKKSATRRLSLFLLLLAVYCLGSCASYQPATVIVKRAGTYMDDGKLYVYVDGKQINPNQPVGKGQTRSFSVSNGIHKIWVMVDRLESDRIQFTAEDNTLSFDVSTQRIGGSKTLLIEYGDG